MYDVSNTSPDIQLSGVDIAILPIGAIEQHGPHLPLSTDWAQAEATAKLVASRLDAFLLPGIPYGNSQAHTGFRGSVSLSQDTLGLVVKEICRDLIKQDFHRLVVLNFHGGNLVLKLAVRELNQEQSRAKVLLVQPIVIASDRISKILESFNEEQHAGEMETSMMQHIAPDSVTKKGIDHVPGVSPAFFDYLPMKEYCPDGVWGRPSLASASKGGQMMEAMVDASVMFIQSTFMKLGLP